MDEYDMKIKKLEEYLTFKGATIMAGIDNLFSVSESVRNLLKTITEEQYKLK